MSRAAPPETSAATTFLHTLFDDVPGLIEFRALPSGTQRFLSLARLDQGLAWVAEHLDEDLYVGVATRRDATSGAGENCLALGALFSDIDFKKVPEREARARIAAFPLPPTMMVSSGGGLHVYYGLRESLALPDEAARRAAKTLLRRLALKLGGDLSAAEPARILRVPSTYNHKYIPPRWVTLEMGS